MRNKIYTVGKSAFKGCGRLVINGDEFNEASLLDDYAFYECASIPSIQLSAALNKLGLKVFWGCKSLQRIEIDPKMRNCCLSLKGLSSIVNHCRR